MQGWLELPILDSYYDKLKSQFLVDGHHSLSIFIEAFMNILWNSCFSQLSGSLIPRLHV